MTHHSTALALALSSALWAPPAHSFCGLYVAAGDARLFNRSSKVVLVRDGDRTVLTMANDFRGDPKQFAIVIPVPVVLEKGQIQVGEPALIDHLDAYSAPRLVEYFDEDPCQVAMARKELRAMAMSAPADQAREERSLGVRVEARYTVGEYDIVILSATQSGGLEQWLREHGYRVPAGAARVLHGYVRQGLKFFVAKVNLAAQRQLGFGYRRPIRIAYESPRFMLPIRLGMVNADGAQELFVYALTRHGRVETTNYRTVKIPSDLDVPEYVKDAFPDFYRALFDHAAKAHGLEAVFTEYAWDMSWCDPCAADPLSSQELRKLGVFWLEDPPAGAEGPSAAAVFLTRLHVRYDRAHFPEDLVFQETADREYFQGRYILRHPWQGTVDCPAARSYRAALRERREQEARNLAGLTGWSLEEVRAKMSLAADGAAGGDTLRWWETMDR